MEQQSIEHRFRRVSEQVRTHSGFPGTEGRLQIIKHAEPFENQDAFDGRHVAASRRFHEHPSVPLVTIGTGDNRLPKQLGQVVLSKAFSFD